MISFCDRSGKADPRQKRVRFVNGPTPSGFCSRQMGSFCKTADGPNVRTAGVRFVRRTVRMASFCERTGKRSIQAVAPGGDAHARPQSEGRLPPEHSHEVPPHVSASVKIAWPDARAKEPPSSASRIWNVNSMAQRISRRLQHGSLDSCGDFSIPVTQLAGR